MKIGLYLTENKLLAFISRANWLMPYRDVVFLLYELHGTYVMVLCGQNRKILDVTARCAMHIPRGFEKIMREIRVVFMGNTVGATA